MAARVSQVVGLVVQTGNPFSRVSQVVGLVVQTGNPFSRVSQVVGLVAELIPATPQAAAQAFRVPRRLGTMIVQ
jgi:hypothetical protein